MIVSYFLVVLGLFAVFTAGQTNHVITVGQLGSFYNPPTLSAGLNDTVTFTFLGPFHTVTQSSQTAPCVTLPGGFNSGVLGLGINGTNPVSSWTLTITNVSERVSNPISNKNFLVAIWYFCQISTPTSHCGSGMVGAINPPSQEAYQQFKAAAEAVSGTPTSRARTSATQRPMSDMSAFFQYGHPGPVHSGRPSEAAPTGPGTARDNSTSALPLPRSGPGVAPGWTTPLVPTRRSSPPPALPEGAQHPRAAHHALARQGSVPSSLGASPSEAAAAAAAGGGAPPMSAANMKALAHEVAAMLLRAPSGTTLNDGLLSLSSDPSKAQSALRVQGRLSPGNGNDPPAY
ncbi:hypothetical protein HYPSUDRAFT_52433 [Hypholoma sublateritium FD-334 SS-4]|uniref:Uncharacterized protein n=1 Tax=Hypholoma sublateritium (strain FD-334 SS-4) TaxID=945553 RepID=A0A0D2PD87_HYPSF|nr:hypothetical protein HYPSUDRAFT_52433 [Hypholoma sublateritium FD-334 SS-4]